MKISTSIFLSLAVLVFICADLTENDQDKVAACSVQQGPRQDCNTKACSDQVEAQRNCYQTQCPTQNTMSDLINCLKKCNPYPTEAADQKKYDDFMNCLNSPIKILAISFISLTLLF